MKKLIIGIIFLSPISLIADTKPRVFTLYDYYAHIYKVEPAMVYAIAYTESTHNPNARNKTSGASGLFQLMPKTAKWFCGINKKDLLIPETNVDCGVRYFVYLKRMFGGSDILALSAYHSGPTTVNDYRFGKNKSGMNPKLLKAGYPPWDRRYVGKVFRARAKYL